MVLWRCGWKHLHRHHPFTQNFNKRMRISRHFLIPFLGVSVMGGAVLLVATRSGLDDVSSTSRPGERAESVIREQAGGHQFSQNSIVAISLDDKSSAAGVQPTCCSKQRRNYLDRKIERSEIAWSNKRQSSTR